MGGRTATGQSDAAGGHRRPIRGSRGRCWEGLRGALGPGRWLWFDPRVREFGLGPAAATPENGSPTTATAGPSPPLCRECGLAPAAGGEGGVPAVVSGRGRRAAPGRSLAPSTFGRPRVARGGCESKGSLK